MADAAQNAFEIERRAILWTPLTTLNDEVTPLGWDDDPNDVVNGNSDGETWLYGLPIGQFYKQNNAILWWKSDTPNIWISLGSGGTSIHNNLTGLQGGDPSTDEFYHLTSADLVVLDNTSNTNTGDQDLSDYFLKTVDDTADITEATDKNFVTDANLVVLGNTSNTNTGDQSLVIGGSPATGEVVVADASDLSVGLGSQGTATQVLTSAGASSNPTWEDAAGGVTDHSALNNLAWSAAGHTIDTTFNTNNNDIDAGTGDYLGENMTLTLGGGAVTATDFCIDGVTNPLTVGASSVNRADISNTLDGTWSSSAVYRGLFVIQTADATFSSSAAPSPTSRAFEGFTRWNGDYTSTSDFGAATIEQIAGVYASTLQSDITINSGFGFGSIIFNNTGGLFQSKIQNASLNETAGTLTLNNIGGEFRQDNTGVAPTITGTPIINYLGGKFDGTGRPSYSGAGTPVTTSIGGEFTAGNADTNIGIDVTDISGGTSNIAIRTAGGDIILVGLPSSDPSVPGQLYHTSGTVKISL